MSGAWPRPAVAAVVAGLLLVGSACGSSVDEVAAQAPAPSGSAAPAALVVPVAPRSTAAVPSPTSRSRPTATVDPGVGEEPVARLAYGVLGLLPVKGRASMSGYDRAEFGPAWLDADRNGCDTRNDVLRAYLTDLLIETGTYGCKVSSGVLADPYTAQRIDFVVGDGTLVDVDHVVSLGDAWVTGAAPWPIRRRAAFANDSLNLLPVDASANRQKGDGDAATWLPSNKPFRCSYVSRQLAVKQKYGLWLKPAEQAAIGRVLTTCPGLELPVDVDAAPVLVSFDVPEPSTSATPSTPATPATPGSGDPEYANCDAARAAGAAPVHRGDPGYGPHLDGDGDGSACE